MWYPLRVLTWTDWIVVCAPVVLGVLGALLSIQQPGEKSKLPLILVLILLGAGTTAATLYQIRQTRITDRTARAQDEADKRKLQGTIDDLHKQIGVLSDTSIPALVGDVNGLKRPKLPPPDLTISFVHPLEVAILIHNAANSGIADRPKYAVALIDLESVSADFLRIPTTMGDYIRPGGSWGPNEFMGIDGVKSVSKHGDRIFGSVEVSCPTCVTDRGYWVYIKVGEGGWYAEQQGPPKVLTNLTAIQRIADDFDAFAASLVPPSKRIPIE